jgi:hypothetical protein
MVDSTGLLGMALAFRAAAGEIAMSDDGEQQFAKMKPWTAIDNTKAKTSHERSEALARQATLLEEESDRVRENTQRRKDLAREDISQRLRGSRTSLKRMTRQQDETISRRRKSVHQSLTARPRLMERMKAIQQQRRTRTRRVNGLTTMKMQSKRTPLFSLNRMMTMLQLPTMVPQWKWRSQIKP